MVSRDSVRIILLVAALNDLDVQGADIQNAFLNAPNKEKVWLCAGPEFGELEGKNYIVKRALYGLKSAGSSFRAFMAKKLDDLNFKSCPDPDVWRRPAVNQDTGEEYYEYIMTYVDDLIAISLHAKEILQEIQKTVKFKNDKIEEPDTYLGAQLTRKFIDGRTIWAISSQDYTKAAVDNIEAGLKKKGLKLPVKAATPMIGTYTPELDGTTKIDEDETQFFQELIGILRCATELGCVDILHEVSILSQYQASPRQGHLEQALHIVAYLKKKPKLSIYMDPDLPNVDYSVFTTKPGDFHEMYRDAKEQLPFDMPLPRGKPVTTTAWVDASHGANKITQRSHTGFIIFVNQAPIHWYSKRQNTVESSAFSSEFIAMKTCVETIQGLRYKLRMFGIPILETKNGSPAHIFCDNDSVVNNCSKVESVLNKKHSSIAYHATRWAVAARIVTVGWIATAYNLADAFTKRLSCQKRADPFEAYTY